MKYTNTPFLKLIEVIDNETPNFKHTNTNKIEITDNTLNEQLFNIICQRTQSRYLNKSSVKQGDLLEVLKSNYHFCQDLYLNSDLIEQFVILNGMPEYSDGIYIFNSKKESLNLLKSIGEEEFLNLYLQSEFSYAPVTIVFIGKLKKALGLFPNLSGYPILLKMGTSLAHYSWLQITKMDYAGTIFAGPLPNFFRNLTGIDGFYNAQIIGFTFGSRKYEGL